MAKAATLSGDGAGRPHTMAQRVRPSRQVTALFVAPAKQLKTRGVRQTVEPLSSQRLLQPAWQVVVLDGAGKREHDRDALLVELLGRMALVISQ